MSPVMIRDADPKRDAAACAAIYAPHVEASPTSFEERVPSTEEMAARIERVSAGCACSACRSPAPASPCRTRPASASTKRSGFTAVGVSHRIGWKAGAWRDVGWYELELVPAGPGTPPEPLPPDPPPSPGYH